jgi:hypothetical protein
MPELSAIVSFTPCFSWVLSEPWDFHPTALAVSVRRMKPLKRFGCQLVFGNTQLKQGVNESQFLTPKAFANSSPGFSRRLCCT